MITLNKILRSKLYWIILISGLLIYNLCTTGLERGWFFTQDQNSFRNTKWGMSFEEVKSIASGRLIEFRENPYTYSYLKYENDVDGYQVETKYDFYDNKLLDGFYAFQIDSENAKKHIEAYYKVGNILAEKYGNPVHASESCEPSPKLLCIGRWNTFNTEITLFLTQMNIKGKIDYSLGIHYRSTKFEEVREKVLDTVSHDDF